MSFNLHPHCGATKTVKMNLPVSVRGGGTKVLGVGMFCEAFKAKTRTETSGSLVLSTCFVHKQNRCLQNWLGLICKLYIRLHCVFTLSFLVRCLLKKLFWFYLDL